MKIFGFGPSDVARLYTNNSNNKKPAINGRDHTAAGDTLQISPEAKVLSCCKAVLKDMPLVREELVNDFKYRIDSGTYKPDAGKIAEGILKEQLFERVR